MARSDNIGYSPNKLYILIPNFLSIIMNALFIIQFIIKISSNNNKNKMSSLRKILLPLSIFDSLISLLWFLTGIFFKTEEKINDNELGCKIIGGFLIFCYISDWLLVYFSITHLKNMILNPINYILKPKKKIIKYISISGITSLVLTILSYSFEMIGKSPMLTCFLSLEKVIGKNDNKTIKYIIIIIICYIPIFFLILGFLNIILVCTKDSYKNDKENKKIFKEHSLYLIIYQIMNIFMVTIYLVKLFHKNYDNENFYFILSFLICLTPLIVGIIRIYQTKIIESIYKSIKRIKNNKHNKRDTLLNFSIREETTFEQFETSAIEKFVMNIYIAICFCLEKQMKEKEVNYEDLNENMKNETNGYQISKKLIFKQLSNGYLINDTLMKKREEFSISCVEFAPTIFRFLRKLDDIGEDFIVNSMLPMNNKIGINETEGKGGSFFINSDDHEFILKTITYEELEIMRKLLLNNLVNYFYQNNDSLICRIYGAYKISMSNGLFKEDEIYFILMKNVIGSFTDNLMCKYDLKGSSLNRKVEYEDIDTKVMKDLNFNEVEEVFLINKRNSEKLIDIVAKDATFLCSLGIMDYSLLVVKISLNKNEINFLFGKAHKHNSEIDYFDMINMKREDSYQNSDANQDVEKDRKTKGNDNNFNGIRFISTNIGPLRKYFFPSLKWDILYIMSIIDFFQLYDLHKNFETKYKQIANRINAKYISSVPPEDYRNRFIEFIKKKSNSEKYLKEIYDPENKNDF